MSLKYYIIAIVVGGALGCNSEKATNKFAHLSEKEKDSVATMYHDISMKYYQPSEMHRKYKDSALMAQPNHAGYRERWSYSYKKTGEHIKAMQLLNEAVEQDVENGKTFALQYRAWSLLYFYRDYEGTIRDVDLINKMLPKADYTTCHGEPCDLLKGQALYKLGKFEEAITVFTTLLGAEEKSGFNPLDNYLAYFYTARCYTEIKDYENAIKYHEDQLAVYDEFTEAHFQLGKLYNTLGNKEKAKYHLEKSSDLLSKSHKMNEPYFERFDEVFLYQIEEELHKI